MSDITDLRWTQIQFQNSKLGVNSPHKIGLYDKECPSLIMTTLVIIHDIFVVDVGSEQYYNIEFQTIFSHL